MAVASVDVEPVVLLSVEGTAAVAPLAGSVLPGS